MLEQLPNRPNLPIFLILFHNLMGIIKVTRFEDLDNILMAVRKKVWLILEESPQNCSGSEGWERKLDDHFYFKGENLKCGVCHTNPETFQIHLVNSVYRNIQ